LAENPASDDHLPRAAEIDAALRLSWIGKVERIRKGACPTPDLRVEGFYCEIYCPQQHAEEREVVQSMLDAQLDRANGSARVAVAIGYPTLGSGRFVDQEGTIQRKENSRSLEFPSNKIIDRILGT